MKPYYHDDKSGITIFHGDCRGVMPFLPSVDLVLTDPPYGIGEARNKRANQQHGKAAAPSKDYGASNWDDRPPRPWLIEQAIEQGRYAIVWGGNYFSMPPSSCWLVWDKDNGNNGYADCELAWTNLQKAVRRTKYRWMGMLQEHMGKDKEERFHPTQKPLAVMQWAMTQAPDDCKTILDPWMGSGTTLLAAKLSGRKAIGVEIEEKYCEIAANRLAQGVLFGAAV